MNKSNTKNTTVIQGHTYPMETPYRSGRRFIPVRICDGQMILHTEWVTDTPEEAVSGAWRSDKREMGPEWAAENALVGVAEVSVEILNMHSLESLGLVALYARP
jgi:hypothetical protein